MRVSFDLFAQLNTFTHFTDLDSCGRPPLFLGVTENYLFVVSSVVRSMTFFSAAILKIIGGFATAVFTYLIGRRVFVIHKSAGFWNIGKTLIVISWLLKWGTPFLFMSLYKGTVPDQTIAIMWLSCFFIGHWLFRPVGKLFIA